MKSIKYLGLAIAIVVALTGFSGIASASPGIFTAQEYSATLTGEATGGKGELKTVVGTALCASPKLSATLTKPSETLAPSAEYSPCGAGLEMNGCEYIFHPIFGSVNGTLDIGGAKCSGINGRIGGITRILILPQAGLTATFENQGEGSTASVKMQLQTTALKYEVLEGPLKGTYSTGTYTTAWSVTGKHSGSATGVSVNQFPGLSIIGEGEEQVFHSDLYPVTISGTQTSSSGGVEKNELKMNVGTLKCEVAKFNTPSGEPGKQLADSEDLFLTPTYEKCLIGGAVEVTVKPEAGCMFDLVLSASFVGNMGVCNMELVLSNCTITVPGQIHAGMKYANAGSGSSAKVRATADVSGMEYQLAGSKCPNNKAPGTYNDGKYKGTITLEVGKVG